MRRYLGIVLAEAKRQSTYRLALAAGIFTNGVFGLIRAGVMLAAVAGAGGAVAGYTSQTALSYVWWGQALLGMLPLWWWNELAERVRTGDIAVDLARPIDLQLYWWCRDLGRAAVQFAARGIPLLIIGSLLLPMTWSTSPITYLSGAVSLLLALAVNFLARWSINLIAMWTLDITGYLIFYGILAQLLAGFLVPVHLFPDWLATIAWLSPFPSMFQTPIDVLSGRSVGAEAATAVAIQAAWVVGLLVLTRVVGARAVRRLEVQGG